MQEDWKPMIGMVFDSIEDAWKFWVDYGGKIGFRVRKQYSHKKKDGSISSSRFVCCKEGLRKPDKRDYKIINPRPETRTSCPARIGFKDMGGKFTVYDFVEEHNHSLHPQETQYMLSSEQKVSEVQCHQIELADENGLQQSVLLDLTSKKVGGSTSSDCGYALSDQKNNIRKRRKMSLVNGEVNYLLQYFQRKLVENPTSYHAYQIDDENKITNVFWADAGMLVDYGYFGDVVFLDSTYCTDSSQRPLVVFSGFNHHRRTVIFGAALLYDETRKSYKWLFERFLEAHKQKMPQTIFTAQNLTMEKALVVVMPKTYHGLCTRRLIQDGIENLGNLMKDGSDFLIDFKKCMYDYEDEEQFENGWKTLIERYNVKENTWLQRMYTMKKKWAACYMKSTFTLGMQSTQFSESVNANIISFMKTDLDIIKFFEHFENIVEENRFHELKCEYEARLENSRLKYPYSGLLQHVSKLYAPTIFDLFQHEYELFEACSVKSKNLNLQASTIDFVISMVGDMGEWRLSFDLDKTKISCSCRKFESFGILCCHCVKVFIHMDVKSVPTRYILKRLTKLARSGASPNVGVSHGVEDIDLSPMQRYKEICPRLIRIAIEACRSKETFTFLSKVIDELDRQMLELQNNQASISQGSPLAKVRDSM
ncbi:protein FAR1-RELATED SEQUENCE 5-like [Vicia villosa]|uniref:protein FAR1-RELATED SEQUENCE 5-like n=1 Tax=Vicia villosa TaxID=3911 RepID=UPI00273C4BAF|nr:protein FAR1-RELATED SEQUENCE 5-like [Vicia villosa]XP_058731891.1 protein FAR1-RELATED SEQUENCE 5-like [Vicia villosa]